MTKLILVEGIPGSGKSTIAGKIAERYRARGREVRLYLEGSAHPADLGWNACVPLRQYEVLLEKYASLRGGIEVNTGFEGEYAVVAYTRVKTDNKGFYKELEAFEVYDGRAPDDVFFRLHYDRWRAFGEAAAGSDALNIFECAFLQNHVNELLFWRDVDEDAVIAHCGRLMDSVKQLSPVLIYLSQPDIRETISRVAAERVSPDGERWIDRVDEYCENSSFGRRRGVKGLDGAMEFFEIRKRLELKIIAHLPISCRVIENPAYDWGAVWAEIEAYLDGIDGGVIA